MKKVLIFTIILFAFSFADLRIKTGEEEVILKGGKTYFTVNDSKEKYIYLSLIDNSIVVNIPDLMVEMGFFGKDPNGKIAIDSINSISIVENMGSVFFASTLLFGLYSASNSKVRGNTFLSTQAAKEIAFVFYYLPLSGVAGGLGYLIKFYKKYELKNDNCSNNSPCTEWEVITK
jgi:hypothetical protein